MLKKFFWNLLSSFVGAWIALLGFGVLMFFVIVGLVRSEEHTSELQSQR